ncbi:FtsQ-type POTRA domain-containing protein [Mesorhizobium sp. NBSH29]|nr:FtsQ-type POTRA domain-containing protein [Mesorhizobium sp. NBSH29]
MRFGQVSTKSGARQLPAWLSDGFVLPRWLRKPARALSRAYEGDYAVPPFAATGLSALCIGAFSIYGAFLGGHMPQVIQAVAARTGFAVDQVRIVGHRQTSEIDVLQELGLDGWTSLIGFDAEHARQRVATLPWVQTAAIRKVYPDEIEISIDERRPFAVWQHGSELVVIEENGNVIAPFASSRDAELPLVIGLGASEDAAGFVKLMQGYPALASRSRGYIRVGERRWDVRLDNGVTIKLPERGEREAIEQILAMDEQDAVLSSDIVAIDMRFDDRLVVQLTPEALERRNASLDSKGKPKKTERRI